jgi:hypothetical protein
MPDRLRLLFVGLLPLLLLACGENPDDIAKRDGASLDQLHNQGASIESMRQLLTGRSYGCTDGSGSFAAPDGSIVSAQKYVYCTKSLPGSLFCTFRVQIFLVPDARGGTGIYFDRRRTCT